MTAETPGRTLPSPGLSWERGHTPSSDRFGDVYYSRSGGLAESRHVFLAGNDLPQRWQTRASFCIAELGFGTGLNFLATWELWRRSRKPGSRLHYLAVEGFPLSQDELRECLAPWAEVGELSAGLIGAYPAPQRGFHRVFPVVAPADGGDVVLTFLFGEAAEMLAQLEAQVDAWFLDGFAPDKNPAMWSAEIFAEMARLSHYDTHVATYSVAGAVRRGLGDAGFEAERAPGFGQKREMLRARFRTDAARASALQPWFARAPGGSVPGRAAIIGSGLAGASTAAALGRRGWRTIIIDRHAGIAEEASGTPRTAMAPRLTAAPSLDGRFYAAAWRFALKTFERSDLARVGSLQLAESGEDAARMAAIAASSPLPADFLQYVEASEAAEISGLPIASGGLFFPHGGWIQPRAFCASVLSQSELRLGTEAASLAHDGGQWQVKDAAGRTIAGADVVVFASAGGIPAFPQAAWLPLEFRRGQVSLLPTNPLAERLRTVLMYGGYLTPAHHGLHVLGSTFDFDAANDVRAADHLRNLESLAAVVPALFPSMADVGGFAAVRCMSPDHLPMVGPLPDRDTYLEQFGGLRHGHPWARYPSASYQHGLYVLTALGARGVISAPLAAELLASHISGDPWPLERDLVTALHPARFLVRELKRRDV